MLLQNYNFPTKTLMNELELSGFEIGQVKATLKRELLGRQSRSQRDNPEEDKEEEVTPPTGRELGPPPAGKELGPPPTGKELGTPLYIRRGVWLTPVV